MVYVANLLNDSGYDLTYDLALMLARLRLLASCSCVVYAIATKWLAGWWVLRLKLCCDLWPWLGFEFFANAAIWKKFKSRKCNL